MDRDEELLRGRVYGVDHDDPRRGPQPGHVYGQLVGGPLDGLLLDITGWTPEETGTGVALETELGRFGVERAGDIRPAPRRRDPLGLVGRHSLTAIAAFARADRAPGDARRRPPVPAA